MTCKLERSVSRIISLDNLLEYFKYLEVNNIYSYDSFSKILNTYKYFINKYQITINWDTYEPGYFNLEKYLSTIILKRILGNVKFDNSSLGLVTCKRSDLSDAQYLELQKFSEYCRFNIDFL